MRKHQLLSVLSLFLLVPASITRAQTATLTGTVSIEQDYRTVNFNSPKGHVKVILPGNLNGPEQGTVLLSGTVVAEPAGKTEKEKNSNLKSLQKMLLTIGGKSISILPGQNHFDFSMPANLTTPVPIDMVDPGGNRATVILKNPVILPPATTGEFPTGQPSLTTDQKIFLTNGNITIYAANNTSTLFQPTDKFFTMDAGGTKTEAIKMAQSPTQTVLSSQGMQPGATTITRQSGNRTDQVKVRMASLTLSSPNTDLRKGQTSSLTVTIDPKITDKDSAEAMQIPIMSLDIKNLTPNVIDMAGGNYQVMTFPSGSNPGNTGSWQATRTITGVTPGSFNVSATLYPSAENTNPVHSQLEEIKTAEDFNKWANAIKKDLQAYLKDIPPDDLTRRDPVQRTIDQMPSAISDADLGVAKMEASYLLRWLPTFRNYLAGEGFAAFQTYMSCNDRLKNAGPKTGWPLHVDIINSGLNFIQNQNRNPVNETIQQQVNTALKATSAVQQDYSAKTINELATVLQTLNNSPFVTGLADVNASVSPFMLQSDEPIAASKDGEQIKTASGEFGRSVEVYDDNTIVINTQDGKKERFNFTGVTPSGTNLEQLVMQFYDRKYSSPYGIGCDSLTKLCKKSQALTIFWGDVYSVSNGIKETKKVNGETIEKSSQSSLLLTRGWEVDCCTGKFELKLFIQVMKGGQAVSFTDVLNIGSGGPCPGIIECAECKERCKKDKAMREAAKKQ